MDKGQKVPEACQIPSLHTSSFVRMNDDVDLNDRSSASYERVFSTSKFVTPLPVVVVDLSKGPQNGRWSSLSDAVNLDALVTETRQLADEIIFKTIGLSKSSTFCIIFKVIIVYLMGAFLSWFTAYHQDVKALAKLLKLHVGELFLVNIIYEISGGCTSFVAIDCEDSCPIHGRTLDWPTNFLAKYSIHFIWTRNNEVLFHSVGWPGYVGVLTGVKPGRFAISLNARYPHTLASPWACRKAALLNAKANTEMIDGEWLTSAWQRLSSALSPNAWINGNLIRHLLETQGTTFESAARTCTTSRLCVASYFIISGTMPTEGTIISRGVSPQDCKRRNLVGGWECAPSRWPEKPEPEPLVQTNIDWEDFVSACRRPEVLHECSLRDLADLAARLGLEPNPSVGPGGRHGGKAALIACIVELASDHARCGGDAVDDNDDECGGEGGGDDGTDQSQREEAGDGGAWNIDFNSVERHLAATRMLRKASGAQNAVEGLSSMVQDENSKKRWRSGGLARGSTRISTRRRSKQTQVSLDRDRDQGPPGDEWGSTSALSVSATDVAKILTSSLKGGNGVRMKMTLHMCVMKAGDEECPLVPARPTREIGP